MKEINNIVIVGMGALGIMYGNFLIKKLGSQQVTFLGDQSRINKLAQDGILCNEEKCDFTMMDPQTAHIQADLLIFAVKATALENAVKLAKPAVKEDTIILSLLNGISSEEYLEAQLDQGTVITCVAQGMDAVKIGNEMTYANMGKICLGITPEQTEKQESLDKVLEFFDRTELPYTLEEDINYRLWGKWMLNVGVNQVVMVTEGTYETVQQDGEAREMMKAAMSEVILIAQEAGVNLTDEDLNGYLDLVGTLNPQGMPSMRQDGLTKRKSEVELFAGTVIKKARQYGIAVPVNEKLYQTIIEMEKEY